MSQILPLAAFARRRAAPKSMVPRPLAQARDGVWRPGLAQNLRHSELFAAAREGSGAGLALALALVTAGSFTSPLLIRSFARAGDRYARSGSPTMARVVYFVGGLSPVFPDAKAHEPAVGSSSAAAPRPGGAPSVTPAMPAPSL